MAFQHGVRVLERETSILAPITGTAGLQVVFGTAPINLAADPYAVTNVPVMANSWSEAVSKLGYSDELDDKGNYKYTLCASMYTSFKLFNVAPVIFVNVLDPKTHKKEQEEQQYDVKDGEVILPQTGILLDTLKVKKADEPGTDLTLDTEYTAAFNDAGQVVITLIGEEPAKLEHVKASYTYIDPSAVDKTAIIGTASAGKETGLEVLRQIYPKFGMTPGLLLAPGWSHIPDVGIVLAAKCEEINGYFSCEAFVDIDSTSSGATTYDAVKAVKEKAGCNSAHVMALWPCVVSGSYKFWASAVWGALTAYMDASNDDVPNLSPSNQLIGLTGTVLADAKYTETDDGGTWDKEIVLDQLQANVLNSYGVSTAYNNNGWRTWGNRSACYPSITDPKDMWFCVRRFFSWWGNSFILTYAQKVDNPANRRLIESIVDTENIRGNAYVAQGKCAAARIEFLPEENAVTDLINGKLTFHTHLAPYVPAEDIVNTLEFDPDALRAALIG